MTHTVTGKLNKAVRSHQSQAGTTFFVDIGEKNYNFKTKANEFTNYSAAVFAKDGQIQFYSDALVEGAIVSVTGTGIIIDMPDDAQYKPRLAIQDAKVVFVSSGAQHATPQNNSGGFVQKPAQPRGSYQQPQQQNNQAFDDGPPF
jgi:single-strand DNA-binding protein